MLTPAFNSFVVEERIVWVSIEGLSIKTWTKNSFKKIASKCGELIDWEDFDDNSWCSTQLCIKTKVDEIICEQFKIIVQGKPFWLHAKYQNTKRRTMMIYLQIKNHLVILMDKSMVIK